MTLPSPSILRAKGWSDLSRLRVFWTLVISHFVLSVSASIFHYCYLRQSYLLFILHPLLAMGILFLLMLALGAVSERIRPGIAFRSLASLLLTLWSCLLLLLYIANWASNHLWGSNIFYGLVIDYALHFYTYIKLLFAHPYLLIAAGFTFILALFTLYFKYSSGLLSEAQTMDLWLFKDRTAKIKSLAVAASCVALFIVLFWSPYRGPIRQRELIISFLNTPPMFPDTSRRLAAVQADRDARRQYSVIAPYQKRNVILIISDCLRADRMQVYGYARATTPFLSSLQQSGHLRRAEITEATCPNSSCGILSILTSKPASEISIGNFKLTDLLRDQGYRINWVLSGTHTFWYDMKKHYEPGNDFYFDSAYSRHYLPTDDQQLFEALDRVPSFNGQPSFFYFHLMSTHNLGIKREQYIRFQPAQKMVNWGKSVSPETSLKFSNEYDNGVLQADDTIRLLFEHLHRKGYLKDSLVVITGDHGQALGEHGEYGHDTSLYQEQMAVPILIYDYSSAEYKGLDFATQADIAPTIVDRLGLPIPTTWRGYSLLQSNSKRLSYHEIRADLPQAVIETRNGIIYKYIRTRHNNREELYELHSDPHELHNLIETSPPDLIISLRENWRKEFGDNQH